MSDKENLQFPIPNAVLEPYIKEAVSTAIISAMGDTDKLIVDLVNFAINQKVNEQGNVSKERYYNSTPFIEWVSAKTIREIAKQCIFDFAKSQEGKIKEQVTAQLKRQHPKLAKAVVDGLIDSLNCQWNIKVSLKED